MVHPSKIFGRLGNSLFQYAFLYAKTRELGVDFYLQDPEYFDKYTEEIKTLFGTDIKPVDMVSIHVRRGDYVKNAFYVDLTKTDYYEKSMDLFPDAEFLVFSDDVDFCRWFFKGKQFTFCEEKDEIKALNLMAGCKDNIIANSTFSLWAGILNPNPNKRVIAPIENKYYTDGAIRTKYPKDFTQLDFM